MITLYVEMSDALCQRSSLKTCKSETWALSSSSGPVLKEYAGGVQNKTCRQFSLPFREICCPTVRLFCVQVKSNRKYFSGCQRPTRLPSAQKATVGYTRRDSRLLSAKADVVKIGWLSEGAYAYILTLGSLRFPIVFLIGRIKRPGDLASALSISLYPPCACGQEE